MSYFDDLMMQTDHGFAVPFSFPVFFTRDAWLPDNRVFLNVVRRLEFDRRHRVLVALDDHVAAACPTLAADIVQYFAVFAESLELVAPPLVVPGGEAAKNDLTHPLRLLGAINDAGLDRQSFVTVVGGGAVLDMVSFASAIAHRGIRVIRMPTTVLSQADSGVAVKNGVNLFGKKNFVGTFVPPFAVINDARFLESLERRDRICGVVEAIKVALLKDPAFYEYLEGHVEQIARGDLDVLAALIRRSADLHLKHICENGDPFELGSARPLDFGHWAAHKLESLTAHRLRHGEAVAIGMALDLTYSVRMGYLDRTCGKRVCALLDAAGFKLWDHALLAQDANGNIDLIQGLEDFRTHLGGELHITLLRSIGESFEVTEMDEAVVLQSIEELAARAAAMAAPPFASAADHSAR